LRAIAGRTSSSFGLLGEIELSVRKSVLLQITLPHRTHCRYTLIVVGRII
jgi:hypothetical protein